MMGRRGILAIFLVLALAAAGPPARADSFEKGAERFIANLADEAISSLTVKDVPHEERVRRFRVLLNESFAVKTIARWVLGRHWRKATPAERREYLKLFEDLLVKTYVDRFARYSGVTLTIKRAIATGNSDALVYSQIILAGGKPLNVGWRVRAKQGRYKIVDVMVEGVSLGQTQRSEFASVINRNGGTVEGLLKELRK